MVDGTLQLVTIEPLGSTLIAAASVGALTLSVDWAVDFAEDGGQCRVNGGASLEFTSADQDADTVTLAKPLTAGAEIGDPVDVLNVRDQPAQKWVAVVELADDQEPVDAIIPIGLIPHFREGDEQAGQQVSLRRDEHGDYVVTGRPDDIPEREVAAAQAGTVVSGPGQAKITLPWEPIENSEHVYWNGIYQPSTEWSRLERVITIPDPDALLRAGDELDVEYLYYTGQIASEAGGVEILDVAGATTGTHEQTATTSSKEHVPLPAGTTEGDLLVLVARGWVGASGGDTTSGMTVTDGRFTLAYSSFTSTEAAAVWIGVADGSTSEVVVNTVGNGQIFNGAQVAIARLRDANGWGTPVRVTGAWPTLDAKAVVAACWRKTGGFVTVATSWPAAYEHIIDTGIGYHGVSLSYAYDPLGVAPTTVTNVDGCVLIPIV